MKVETAHRPWPVPRHPWVMAMRWHELMFMHWPVRAAALRPLIPQALTLDTFDGDAWLGVVPFRMSRIRARGLPPIPGFRAFPELNVRTYVTADGKPGVWFFSLDATHPIAVRVARWSFHLNYYDARMHCHKEKGRADVDYASRRTHRGAPPAAYEARYRPAGAVFHAKPKTLEYFLTERYCLYSALPGGRTFRGNIAHCPWPLQAAEADVALNEMTGQIGVRLPKRRPLLHYADYLEVAAWWPERVGE